MKKQSGWWLVTLALAILCGVNFYWNRILSRKLAEGSGESGAHFERVALGWAYRFAGQTITWPETLEPMLLQELPAGLGESLRPPSQTPGYRLVMAFSELSCDLCRDEQTRFLLDLASQFAHADVVILVHAGTQRYLLSYMHLNGIDFPVWFDRQGDFFTRNRIQQTPLLLLLNDHDEVLAAHAPIIDDPASSDLFQRRCRSFFAALEPTGTE